jgi:hypothetical protein
LTQVEQPQLKLSRRATEATVPMELVIAQKSAKDALVLAMQASGLDSNEICLSLDIDPGHWSRMLKGHAYFPLDKLADFCALVGNRVLPDWIARQVGCGLVQLQSEAERRAEFAEKALAEEQQKVRLLLEALRGSRG